MHIRHLGAVLGAAAALLLGSSACAQTSYVVIDGSKVQINFAAVFSGGQYHPRHVMEGLSGGVPTAVNMTTPGAFDVNCVVGCSGGSGGGVVTNGGTFAVQNTAPIVAGSNTIGTVNIGTISTIATAGNQATEIASLATIATAASDTTTPQPVKIDHTTPGTTDQVRAAANSSGSSADLIQADKSAPISISTATTTQLVALSSGKKIYVTSWDVIAGGTGNLTLEYGTGTACATGTTTLTGAYNLVAQAGIAKGNGLAPVLVIPASNALCALTSAAVQMSGSVSYTQF